VTGYLGRHEHQMDEKGRVSLPADYRRKSDGVRFVLLQWEPTHLTLFPEQRWETLQGSLLGLRQQRPEMRRTIRDVISRAADVEPDKQGRILVPGWLKERAGLDGTVLLVGASDRIELWDPEVFRSLHPEDLEVEPEVLAELDAVLG
jgi:MraZ protein